MAYSNVTPPTLPSYDSVANPYYLIQFEYAIGAENWETVRFWFGAAPLTWNGSAVTNAVAFSLFTYGTGSPEWTAWGVMAEAGEMALTPGPTTADTYMRIYTNHDILDGTGAVWLAKGTITPTEEDKEAEIQIRKKSQLAGIIAAWCAPVRQFPKPTAEPVAFLYNGVGPLPDIYKVYTPELQKAHPFVFIRAIDRAETGEYALWCFSEIIYVEHDGNTHNIAYDTTNSLYFDNMANLSQWASYPTGNGSVAFEDWVIWANFTMYKLDGSVCIEPSKPVPVYE